MKTEASNRRSRRRSKSRLKLITSRKLATITDDQLVGKPGQHTLATWVVNELIRLG